MELARAESLLGQVPIFSHVPLQKRREVLRRMQILRFPGGREILDAESALRAMFIVATGGLQVRKRDAVTGVSFLVCTLAEGESFGEMSLLAGKTEAASLITTEPTTVFFLDRDGYEQMLAQEPEIALSLHEMLANKLVSAQAEGATKAGPKGDAACDEDVAALIPLSLMRMHRVVPVAKSGSVVTVAMVDPTNLIAFDDLRRVMRGVDFEPVQIDGDRFEALLKKLAPALSRRPALQAIDDAGELTEVPGKVGDLGGDLLGTVEGELTEAAPPEEAEEVSLADLEVQVDSGPIVRLANNILLLALREGASDIHVEPQGKGVVVRYRIDGSLQVIQTLPKSLLMGLVSRLKILARMDITVRRIPQDGRISFMYKARRIDFRVNTIPTKFGEKVCMRVLDNSLAGITLDKIISHPESLQRWRSVIMEPYGIIFVTGPTGSGKTTTLYSSLGELNRPDVNISTVEDPIEYDLPGLNQVQVDKASGMDFAAVLRAFLRQDPDIILVGETRDTETAKISIEAALTGHLVFTTLHTNSAAASFMRLDEMGIEPFLISCATVGLVAQRLARRLCGECKEAIAPPKELISYCGFAPGELDRVYRARGCDACGGRGIKGRVGIYEVMLLDDDLKAMVGRKERAEIIHAAAVEKGMLDLAAYGRMLVKEGTISLEEVVRVVSFK